MRHPQIAIFIVKALPNKELGALCGWEKDTHFGTNLKCQGIILFRLGIKIAQSQI